MAQLPDLDKHLLGALFQLLGRLISGAPLTRSIQTLIRTCRKNTPLFRNRYQPDMHYNVPVNSEKSKKNLKAKLERHINKISDLDWPSFAVTSHDKWRWQSSMYVWDHVCHLYCSMLTTRENIPVQMEIMSEYIFLYDPLLNCL